MCQALLKGCPCNGILKTILQGKFYSSYFSGNKTKIQRIPISCQARKDGVNQPQAVQLEDPWCYPLCYMPHRVMKGLIKLTYIKYLAEK